MKRFLLILVAISCQVYGWEIVVNTYNGESYLFDVDPEVSVADLHQELMVVVPEGGFFIEVPNSDYLAIASKLKRSRKQGGYLGYPRNYMADLTDQERTDIHFIVTTLAEKSAISLAFVKGELEARGQRIDHVHPLRFLEFVFTNEQLKAGIHNIRSKGWVWNHFIGGLKDSMTTESRICNMTEEFLFDFSQSVGIDYRILLPAYLEHDWDLFINLLIENIQRKGDFNRYDC